MVYKRHPWYICNLINYFFVCFGQFFSIKGIQRHHCIAISFWFQTRKWAKQFFRNFCCYSILFKNCIASNQLKERKKFFRMVFILLRIKNMDETKSTYTLNKSMPTTRTNCMLSLWILLSQPFPSAPCGLIVRVRSSIGCSAPRSHTLFFFSGLDN